MSISLDVKRLTDILNVMKTVDAKSARLIIQPLHDAKSLIFYCVSREYTVMMPYKDVEGLDKEAFPTIINISLADFANLVGLADSKAELRMTVLKNGNYMTLRVYLTQNADVQSAPSTTDEDVPTCEVAKDALTIKHDIPAYDESQNKRSSLNQISFDLLDTLTYENALETDSAIKALPLQGVLTNLSKCILTDNTQIIMSAQAQTYATCGSRYAVCVADSNLNLAATLNTIHAKALCTALKTVKADTLLCVLDNNQLFISDDKNQLYIQLSLPKAKSNIVHQINGFNTSDYTEHITKINKKLLLNALKAFNVIVHEPQITLTLSNNKLDINNTINFAVDSEDTSEVSYQLNLQTLQNMLQSLSTQYIHLSTTSKTETTDENNTVETQQLLRLAELTENGTLGTKVYSII